MGIVSDAKKAAALLRKALTTRSAVREIHRILETRPPHPPHHYRVAVYFADGAVNMYQLRQWYKPLAELAKSWPVVVLSRVATAAQALLAEDAPPIAFVPTVRDVEAFIADQDIRVVLYVNQNTRNFQMFRYGRRWHVFINHGESDKMYMTTNQYKAYDYAFVAGQAARERLGRVLWDYDIERRTIEIGRPQADHYSGVLPYTSGANDLVEGPFLGGYMAITPPHASATMSGRACALPFPDLLPEERQRAYYYTIFPNLMLSLHPDYVVYYQVWPRDPARTVVRCEWLFHPDAPGRPDFRPDDAVEFWNVTNRQDWRICELSQAGVASRVYAPGPYSPRESIPAAWDRAYLAIMEHGA